MILKTKKNLFFGDLTNNTNALISIFPRISRLLVLFFLFFSISFFLTVNGTNLSLDKSQSPVNGKTAKTVKVKSKSKKVKKKVIIRNDNQKDIDPTSANSPLYNN